MIGKSTESFGIFLQIILISSPFYFCLYPNILVVIASCNNTHGYQNLQYSYDVEKTFFCSNVVDN